MVAFAVIVPAPCADALAACSAIFALPLASVAAVPDAGARRAIGADDPGMSSANCTRALATGLPDASSNVAVAFKGAPRVSVLRAAPVAWSFSTTLMVHVGWVVPVLTPGAPPPQDASTSAAASALSVSHIRVIQFAADAGMVDFALVMASMIRALRPSAPPSPGW